MSANSAWKEISRSTKMLFFEDYLKNDGDFFMNHFVDGHDGIYEVAMWVDWREFDEDIIRYCQDILQDENLKLEIDEDIVESRGIDIYIIYKGVKSKINYDEDKTSRDKTLIALNEAIKEDYQLRFCIESDGSDTLCFVPLSVQQWKYLEEKYPKKVNEKFTPITSNSEFFR